MIMCFIINTKQITQKLFLKPHYSASSLQVGLQSSIILLTLFQQNHTFTLRFLSRLLITKAVP